MFNFIKELFKQEIEILDCTDCNNMPIVELVEKVFIKNNVSFKLVRINRKLWDHWLSTLNKEYQERFKKEKKIVNKYVYD